MDFPLVSVIIPTYNRRDLLLRAVESCLVQNWTNLEIIIIDDGSHDGTDLIVNSLLNNEWRNHKINYILKNNSGASSSRNYGLAVAKGDYIQFLDSDDELMPEKIMKQLNFLEKQNNKHCQMCYCFGRMGVDVQNEYVRIGVESVTILELIHHLVSRKVHVMQTSAPLWRRSFLERNEGWNTEVGLGDDLEYYSRLICSIEQFGFIPEELFFVREHPANRISRDTMTRESLLSAIKTQKLVQKRLIENNCWSPDIATTFWDTLQIIYANSLCYGTKEDILGIEQWLKQIGDKNLLACRKLLFIINTRRLVGARAILFIHQYLKQLRKFV